MTNDFFKQTWVQIISIIIAAIIGGLITFFSATNTKRWEKVEINHDRLLQTSVEVEYNKKALDRFTAQFGELKAATDELKWTARELKIEIEKMRNER